MKFTMQTDGFYRTKIGIEDIDHTTKRKTKSIQYKYWKFYADGRVYSIWKDDENFDYNFFLKVNAAIYETIKAPYVVEGNTVKVRVSMRSDTVIEQLTLIADDTFVDWDSREYIYIAPLSN